MGVDRTGKALALATGAGVFAWFLYLVRGGLASWFDADDLMNLYHYWSRPWSALLKAIVAFWSSYYRPAGGLFYRTIYALWGFHPLPFRVAALILLAVNFVLLSVVVWQLTASRWGTLIVLLAIGINPSFAYAYFDTGAIYDVLAYTFFWGAFAWYVHMRQSGRVPGWGRMALLFCLFALALDAKEIAVSLPAAVALYELAWHAPAAWRPAALWRWIWREGRFAAIGGFADIAYIAGKKYGPDSLWQAETYRPHFSAHAYFESLAHYLGQLSYRPFTLSAGQMGLLLAAMLALAVASRRRCLLWGAGFIAAGVLPLAFITPRGGFAYLVPAAGWAVYIGGLEDWLAASLVGRRAWLRCTAGVLLFAAVAVSVAHKQRSWIKLHTDTLHEMQAHYRRYVQQIGALIPAPRKGAHILLLSDAEGRDDFDVCFAVMLYYGDPRMEVHRMKIWRDNHVQVDPRGYDYVLDWVDYRFVLVMHK